MDSVPVDQVNQFLLNKQHLVPGNQGRDVVAVVRDICALHATAAPTPFLSLWSRVKDFQREQLDVELYDTRGLVKALCMRRTLHIVPSEALPVFFQATKERLHRNHLRQMHRLLVWAGSCREGQEPETLQRLQRQVADALAETGPATVAELSLRVPELKAKVRHDIGKPYEGEFSLGSRLVPGMCLLGTLVRTKPRGTWRSNLHEYASLDSWLPGVDLESTNPAQAQACLVRWYVAAFGPATTEDVTWWTGFSKGETKKALAALSDEVGEVEIEGLGGGHLMLAADHQRLHETRPWKEPSANLLPALDPYIMGYRHRDRFLAPENHDRVFDRAGNAVATAWVDGRVVGIWRAQEGMVEVLVWDEAGTEALTVEARRVGRFLTGQDADAVVKPYPPDVYVKVPFHLARRQ